jgi:organic hydroperoxide reductase OsmC/OhrA
METRYSYHTNAQFHQSDYKVVELEHGAPRIIHFSAPPEFGGEPGLWTPEHFLLAAVASCFVESFRAVAKASKLDFPGIEVGVDGVVEREGGGFRFTTITVRPIVIIHGETEHELAVRLLEKAERICLITRSLSSQITLDPKVLVEKPVAV